MKVKFFTSAREYDERKHEFRNAIESVLKDGISTLGKEVAEFEEKVEKFTGAKYAIGVASGTDALTIASDILGFKDGKEVITSPFTFLASSSCIAMNGGKPVFVDIDPDTFEIDTDRIEEKINRNTVGILPIHLFCQMSNMDRISEIAQKHNLKVLEDAAEAFGMRWKGDGDAYRHSGTIGDMGIFSFFPTKTLGAYGDGGMIVTDDEELGRLARVYRVHGATKKYNYEYLGYNSRLDTLQAAILLVKIAHIDDAIRKRKKVADIYTEELRDILGIRLPKVAAGQSPVYYVFNILAEDRDALVSYLKEREIQTCIYYPKPLHLQKCFDYLGYSRGDFPVAERVSQQILALPIYPEITRDEVEFVCDTIRRFYRGR